MGKTRLFAVAACAAVLVGVGASAALAGEVKGPPQAPCGGTGQPVCTPNTNDTAAPTHAASLCAFSGLNDMGNGQTVSQVQTAADSFKYYGLPKGTPGTACNPTRATSGP